MVILFSQKGADGETKVPCPATLFSRELVEVSTLVRQTGKTKPLSQTDIIRGVASQDSLNKTDEGQGARSQSRGGGEAVECRTLSFSSGNDGRKNTRQHQNQEGGD